MKIELNQFCKYINTSIDFPTFKICLLSGDSGRGKTTIFEAVRFCLYGNNTNIYPSGEKSSHSNPTKICLSLPEYGNIVIERSKPPELLKVKIPKKKKIIELENETAQEYIYSLFGTYPMFCSTCYLAQSQRHPLISLSNKEKFDLLSLLTFGVSEQDHPDAFIQKVEDEIRFTEEKCNEKVIQRNTLLSILKKQYCESSEEEKNHLEEKISFLSEEISSFKDDLEEIIKLEQTQENFQKELTEIKKSKKLSKEYILPILDIFKSLSECERSYKIFNELKKSSFDFEKEISDSIFQMDELQQVILLQKELKNIISSKEQILKSKEDFIFKNFKNLDVEKLFEENLLDHRILKLRKLYEQLPEKPEEIISEKDDSLKFSLPEIENLKKQFDSIPENYQDINLTDTNYLKRLDLEQQLSEVKFNEVKFNEVKFNEVKFDEKIFEKMISYLNFELEKFKKCQKLNIVKDENLIREKINLIETHLSSQEKYSKYKSFSKKIDEKEKELSKISTQIKEYEEKYSEKISSFHVENKEQVLARQGQGYICPTCNSSLVLKQNQLIPLKGHSIPDKEAKKLIEYFDQRDVLLSKISDIQGELKIYREEILTLSDGPIIDQNKGFKMLQELRQIIQEHDFTFEDENIVTFLKFETIDEATEKIENLENSIKFNSLKEKINKYPEIPQNIKHDKNLRKNLEKYLPILLKCEKQIGIVPKRLEFLENIISNHKKFKTQEKYLKIKKEIDEIYFEEYYLFDEFSYNDIERIIKFVEKFKKECRYYEEKEISCTKKLDSFPEIKKLSLEECEKEVEKHENFLQFQHESRLFKELKSYTENDLGPIFKNLTIEKIKLSFQHQEKYLSFDERKKKIVRELSEISGKIKISSSKLKKIIQEKNQELLECNEQINFVKECLKISRYISRIDKYEEKKNALCRIKFLALSSRNTALQKFVYEFNNFLNKILEELFDDPISVFLQLEKQNKSNEKIRTFVNFQIFYKGNEFDSAQYLSGGERDRLSLALMLTISSIWGSKIILLDECLSSLNEELRLRCIEVINKYMPGKTIINVCHSVTQGFHDSITEI